MDIVTMIVVAGAAKGARFNEANKALMAELGARCDGELRNGALFASYRGLEFRLRFHAQMPTFALSIVCPEAGRFKLTFKRGVDRWMETFVPARAFRSRDARFDQEFSVQTRDPEVTSATLTKPQNRAAVRALMQSCCTSVRLEDGRMKVFGNRQALGDKPNADLILQLLDQLASLARSVQNFAQHHELRPAPARDPVVVMCWLALGAVGFAGALALVVGVKNFPVVESLTFAGWCALASVLCVGPAAFLLMLAVQRRSSPYGLVRGLVGASLLVVPALVSGGMVLANGLFDETPAQEHLASIVGKSARESDEGTIRYRAGLEPWWPGGDVRWVRISRETHDSIIPEVSQMQIHTHPGWLGYAWIEGYRLRD